MSHPPRDAAPAPDRDPFAPLSTLVDLAFAAVVAFVLFGAAATSLHLVGIGDGVSLFSFTSDVCVESESFMSTDVASPTEPRTEPGSTLLVNGSTFCTHDPSWAMQGAASVGGILSMTLLLGACVLARRVIKIARRGGIFATKPASMMRTLGWFLIAMAVIAPVGNDIGNGIFIAAAAAPALDLTWTMELGGFGLNWTALILGICALTFSRVMYRGAVLQEDVTLTV